MTHEIRRHHRRMPRRLRRFARVLLVAVPSFIAGAVFTEYLAADASRLFFQMLRTDYGAEEEIAAVCAQHRGDVHEAVRHLRQRRLRLCRRRLVADESQGGRPLAARVSSRGDPPARAGRVVIDSPTTHRGSGSRPPRERPQGGRADGAGHAAVGSRGAAARTEWRIAGRSSPPREPRRKSPPGLLPIFVNSMKRVASELRESRVEPVAAASGVLVGQALSPGRSTPGGSGKRPQRPADGLRAWRGGGRGMSLCAKKKNTGFPRRGWNPPPLTPTNGDASRRGASLPRRTWPTSDPVDRFVAALRGGARR